MAFSTSSINGNEDAHDKTIMWFGEHQGKMLVDIPDDYLIALYKSGKSYGRIKKYIEESFNKQDLN